MERANKKGQTRLANKKGQTGATNVQQRRAAKLLRQARMANCRVLAGLRKQINTDQIDVMFGDKAGELRKAYAAIKVVCETLDPEVDIPDLEAIPTRRREP